MIMAQYHRIVDGFPCLFRTKGTSRVSRTALNQAAEKLTGPAYASKIPRREIKVIVATRHPDHVEYAYRVFTPDFCLDTRERDQIENWAATSLRVNPDAIEIFHLRENVWAVVDNGSDDMAQHNARRKSRIEAKQLRRELGAEQARAVPRRL